MRIVVVVDIVGVLVIDIVVTIDDVAYFFCLFKVNHPFSHSLSVSLSRLCLTSRGERSDHTDSRTAEALSVVVVIRY